MWNITITTPLAGGEVKNVKTNSECHDIFSFEVPGAVTSSLDWLVFRVQLLRL